MRTNIVIDDKLMNSTLRATGLKTKREAVELGSAPCCGYGSKRKSSAFAGSSTGRATLMQ
jgi:hypothetical protein